MGIEGAGSYFQSQVYDKVLRGLAQKTLEVYMGDTTTFAKTALELLQRVGVTLARLESFGIAVSPEKVRVGMTEADCVGHLTDHNGLSFTQQKRDRALSFRLPSPAKHMKAFLGLANQLRDHAPSYGALVAYTSWYLATRRAATYHYGGPRS